MILQTLYQQCVKRDVRFFNEFYCLDLLLDDRGHAAGVVAYELANGEIHVFRAKSVLFATGGYGRMFKVTSNAHALTGDGPAVVWRRGIPLEDMEMFQFHPTGLYKLGVLLSEAARGEGAIVRNKDGERFMERYAPTIKDLAPRDMVSRAIYQEIKEGRGDGPNGDYVYLDLTHLPAKVIEEKLPDITEFARVYLKVEPTTEPVPIQPTAHYAMGGIPTDVDARVVVGARRDAGPGPLRRGRVRVRLGPRREPPGHELAARHRGVRPPRRRAHGRARQGDGPGRAAGASGRTHAGPGERHPHPGAGENGADIRKELQDRMFDLAFIVRSEDGLASMQEILGGLRERYDHVAITDKGSVYNTDLMEAVELGFLLDCADALVTAARARTESRGAHFREDHPLRDDANWMKHTLAYRRDDGSISLDYKPVKLGPYIPMERKY